MQGSPRNKSEQTKLHDLIRDNSTQLQRHLKRQEIFLMWLQLGQLMIHDEMSLYKNIQVNSVVIFND